MVVTLLFSMALGVVLEVPGGLPKLRKAAMCSVGGHEHQVSFVQACVTVLLAMSSMFVDRQHAASLNRSTQTAGVCIDRLMKRL